MKLTIWQQFSSNHSAGFMLVGQFATPTLAEAAAQQLQDILARIQAQWQQYPTLEARDYSPYDLSPIEAQIRDEYQLTSFDMSLDWWLEGDDLYDVSVQRDILTVHPPYTHNGPFPFPELVEKLGGKASFWSVMHENELFFTLTCTLPTSQDVETLWNQIEQRQASFNRSLFGIPGVQFVQGYVEKNEVSIRFYDVDLSPDISFLPTKNGIVRLEERATFEEQFTHFLTFIESHPCTSIKYEFYHTEPEWDLPA